LIAGLIALRAEYTGQIWLEVLLLRRLNDSPEELTKLKDTLELIQPDKVHLNTAVRPVVEEYAIPLSNAELEQVAVFLGDSAEVIASFGSSQHPKFALSDVEFLATLARRPQTAGDLAEVLGLPVVAVVKRLDNLISKGRVVRAKHQHQDFYHPS
jgi:wyosine [tRNA(Phe)-imidazoG37] synthetase (radical SAM superfamily)